MFKKEVEVIRTSKVEWYGKEYTIVPNTINLLIAKGGSVTIVKSDTPLAVNYIPVVIVTTVPNTYKLGRTETVRVVGEYINNMGSSIASYNLPSSKRTEAFTSSITALKSTDTYKRYVLVKNDDTFDINVNVHSLKDLVINKCSSAEIVDKLLGSVAAVAEIPKLSAIVALEITKTEVEYKAMLKDLKEEFIKLLSKRAEVSLVSVAHATAQVTDAYFHLDLNKAQEALLDLRFEASLMGVPGNGQAIIEGLLLDDPSTLKKLCERVDVKNPYILKRVLSMHLLEEHKNNEDYVSYHDRRLNNLNFIDTEILADTPVTAELIKQYNYRRPNQAVNDAIAQLYINFAVAINEEESFKIENSILRGMQYSREKADVIYKDFNNRVELENECQEALNEKSLTEEHEKDIMSAIDNLDTSVSIFHDDLIDQNGAEKVNKVHRRYKAVNDTDLYTSTGLDTPYVTYETKTFMGREALVTKAVTPDGNTILKKAEINMFPKRVSDAATDSEELSKLAKELLATDEKAKLVGNKIVTSSDNIEKLVSTDILNDAGKFMVYKCVEDALDMPIPYERVSTGNGAILTPTDIVSYAKNYVDKHSRLNIPGDKIIAMLADTSVSNTTPYIVTLVAVSILRYNIPENELLTRVGYALQAADIINSNQQCLKEGTTKVVSHHNSEALPSEDADESDSGHEIEEGPPKPKYSFEYLSEKGSMLTNALLDLLETSLDDVRLHKKFNPRTAPAYVSAISKRMENLLPNAPILDEQLEELIFSDDVVGTSLLPVIIHSLPFKWRATPEMANYTLNVIAKNLVTIEVCDEALVRQLD